VSCNADLQTSLNEILGREHIQLITPPKRTRMRSMGGVDWAVSSRTASWNLAAWPLSGTCNGAFTAKEVAVITTALWEAYRNEPNAGVQSRPRGCCGNRGKRENCSRLTRNSLFLAGQDTVSSRTVIANVFGVA
jgi:hypothetical protein